MRLTGRLRLIITTASFAVVVAAAATFASQGEPPVPSAGSSRPAPGSGGPVIHVPAVHAAQALVGQSKGTPRLPTSALARLDIPPTALLAYQRAALVMAQADRSCRLSWTLLAAIGRVESDHGRYAGAVLQPDGVSSPLIRGVALDGRGRVARVTDTDGGVLDGDRTWDRAVGPMQFLPSTWSVVAVDGDGDGIRSPDDLDDAALAAGVFLCSGTDDLGTEAGRSAAVFRYNPSRAYVASVLAVEHAYRTGDYTLQGQPPDVGRVHVVVNPPTEQPPTPAGGPGGRTADARADGPIGAGPGAAGAGVSEGSSGHPHASADATGQPSGQPSASSGASSSSGSGGQHPGSAGASSPSGSGGTSGSSGSSGSGGSSGSTGPTGSSGSTGSPGWTDPTDPAPSEPPRHGGPWSGPTAPGPTAPEPTSPAPTSPSATPPVPYPSSDLVTLTGLLEQCGTEPDTFCVADTPLDVGDPTYLAAPATADLDADGTVESNADELDGLVDTQVSVQVLPDTSPALVVTVNDSTYRPAP